MWICCISVKEAETLTFPFNLMIIHYKINPVALISSKKDKYAMVELYFKENIEFLSPFIFFQFVCQTVTIDIYISSIEK
jgi:hypothetical protein